MSRMESAGQISRSIGIGEVRMQPSKARNPTTGQDGRADREKGSWQNQNQPSHSREGRMAVDGQITRASLTNKPSVAGTFAGETPAQIAKHREIARRHRRRCNDSAFIPRLRIAELQRIFVFTYGARCLPDDDAGRADLRLMADHLAQIDPGMLRPWAATWMPTLPDTELDALIAKVSTGRRWKADALARELGLDDATRTRLNIKTIGALDCGKTKRMTRRHRKRIAADRARRARAGASPHAQIRRRDTTVAQRRHKPSNILPPPRDRKIRS